MKKIIIFLFIALWLSSCFWGESIDETGLDRHSEEWFSLLVPESWKKINTEDLPSPQSGEIVFALASPEERQWYINNIVVLRSENTKQESSQSLMKNNASFLSWELEDFQNISEENIIFSDDSSWILLVFSGKYNKQTPELVYLQTARKCNDMSYFITLSLAEKFDNYDRYAYLLKSFECK